MEEAIRSATYGTGFSVREVEVETTAGKSRISYLVCDPLERAGFKNAFSTRLGGVSPLPDGALNLARFKGDSRENVEENRRRFLKAIAAEQAEIVTAHQTHSTERMWIETEAQARGPRPECDALVTRLQNLLLGIQTADCLPILIGDPESGAAGAIHAGWRGTAGRITERMIADLMMLVGANPRTAVAALGPAACASCYEVGQDVVGRYKSEFGYWKKLLTGFSEERGKAHLDIAAANVQQLAFCGFTPDRIHVADYCTMHQNDLFFSYRREARGQPSAVGRLLSVIGKLT
jgi:purine-nucleoside/S-methyl-5'-thioadenosine phosphorylase / adenosine deaminase